MNLFGVVLNLLLEYYSYTVVLKIYHWKDIFLLILNISNLDVGKNAFNFLLK